MFWSPRFSQPRLWPWHNRPTLTEHLNISGALHLYQVRGLGLSCVYTSTARDKDLSVSYQWSPLALILSLWLFVKCPWFLWPLCVQYGRNQSIPLSLWALECLDHCAYNAFPFTRMFPHVPLVKYLAFGTPFCARKLSALLAWLRMALSTAFQEWNLTCICLGLLRCKCQDRSRYAKHLLKETTVKDKEERATEGRAFRPGLVWHLWTRVGKK